jgi:hypothetical protein
VRIPKKVLNMKVKGKWPRGRQSSRWEQQFSKDIIEKEGRKTVSRCGNRRAVRRQSMIETFGCQMTHLECRFLRKKEEITFDDN